ncbi:MAG: hypothetical protein MI673_01610 [Thiotrichales bacterium]|nr:hypothetical protein [Thiotrichales bacterium]
MHERATPGFGRLSGNFPDMQIFVLAATKSLQFMAPTPIDHLMPGFVPVGRLPENISGCCLKYMCSKDFYEKNKWTHHAL